MLPHSCYLFISHAPPTLEDVTLKEISMMVLSSGRPFPSHGLLRDAPPPSVSVLNSWLDDHGIKRSRGLKVIHMDDGDGWKVMSRRDYHMDEILCQIPKTAVLSYRTSSLPSLLPPSHLAPRSSHTILYLTLALLHEFRLEFESPFWGYTQCLPRETILLPFLWGVEELAGEDSRLARQWLIGTEAEKDLIRKDSEGLSMNDLQSFYLASAPHLPPTTRHPTPSPFIAYLHAYSLICTRAFLIDLYHTVALCPFADLFNHSSTDAHTSLSADDFVCHICGSLRACSHDIPSTSGVVRRLEHLPETERQKLENEVDTVDLRVDRQCVDKGDEVLNSYGEKMGQGRLLVEWGFVEENSAGSNITFALEDLGGNELAQHAWTQLFEQDDWKEMLQGMEDTLGACEDIDDRLIRLSPDRPDMFELDQNGQLSINAFAQLYFTLQLNQESKEAGPHIASIVRKIESTWEATSKDMEDNPTGGFLSDTVKSLVIGVVDMLDKRIGRMQRPGLPLDALFDMRDKLTSDENLQRMAMTIAINERCLLESTKEKWLELAQSAL